MTEEHGENKEIEADLDSLEKEIDREIDALFIPVSKAPAAGSGPTATPEAAAAGPIDEKAEAGIDLDSLHLDIDREIDNLLIPAGRENERVEVSGLSMEQDDFNSPAKDTAGLVSEAAPPAGEPAAPAVPAPETRPTPARAPEEDSVLSGAPTGFRSKYPPRADLPRLMEEFNVAYLSLDWDFSADNIRRLEYALEDLESFASTNQGSASVFKILKVLLARLGARPESANTWIVELLRDSQGLLAHLLLTEGSPGQHEKERINALIGRFRQMRERAIAARESRISAETTPDAPVSAAEEPAGLEPISEDQLFESTPRLGSYPLEEPSPPPVSVSGKIPDRWSLLDLKTWMELSRGLLMEAVEGAESELARMRLIESALGKTEALSPVVARLADIRSGLEWRLDALREQDDEWGKRVTWVENLERISVAWEASSEKAAESEVEVTEEPFEQPGPDSDAAPSPGYVQAAVGRYENVFLFRYSGRLYGLPAADVVKARRVSAKKAREILQRGYGSLADLKQLFRSILAGVSGKLTGMSGKELKSIKFNIIGPKVFQAAEAPPDARMAIFVSDGMDYGLILADSDKVAFQAEAELIPEPCSCGAAIGAVRTDSGLCAEILDLGRVFECD